MATSTNDDERTNGVGRGQASGWRQFLSSMIVRARVMIMKEKSDSG
jgi:hypothetical protein